MIVKARHCLNEDALITLYHSFIYPCMTYCYHISGCSAASNLNRIMILQKKVICVICRMKARDSCESKYHGLGMMRFSDNIVYMMIKFMFRVYQGELPTIFGTYFQANSAVHNHCTKRCNYLHVPVVESNRAKANIRYRVAVIWNRIISCGMDLDMSEAVFLNSWNKLLSRVCWICKICKCDCIVHSLSSVILSYIKSLCALVFAMTCSQVYIHASATAPLTIYDWHIWNIHGAHKPIGVSSSLWLIIHSHPVVSET